MSATRIRNNRSIIGWSTAVAGALLVLFFLLSLVAGFPSQWFLFLGELALALVFAIIALTVSLSTLGKVAFWVGAAGWLLLIIGGPTVLFGVLAALFGSVVGGVVLYSGKAFTRLATLAFLVAMMLAALYCLVSLFLGPLIGVVLAVILVFGAALVVAGIFILQKR